MIRILHISDIHMKIPGKQTLEERALDEFKTLNPDYVVITGDSSSGKIEQMRKARDFIDSIPGKKIIVPGNTDYDTYLDGHRTNRKVEEDTEDSISAMTTNPEIVIPPDGVLHFSDYSPVTKSDIKDISEAGYDYLMLVTFKDDHNRAYLIRKRKDYAPKDVMLPKKDLLSSFRSIFSDMNKTINDSEVLIFPGDSTGMSPLELEPNKAVLQGQEVFFGKMHDGNFSDDQYDSLVAELARPGSEDRFNILAVHHPIIRPRWSSDFGPFYNQEYLTGVLPVLNVHAVLAGHKHIPGIAATPSWDYTKAATTYHVTAGSLFSEDRKAPYVSNNYVYLEKNGKSVDVYMKTLGVRPIRVGGFDIIKTARRIERKG